MCSLNHHMLSRVLITLYVSCKRLSPFQPRPIDNERCGIDQGGTWYTSIAMGRVFPFRASRPGPTNSMLHSISLHWIISANAGALVGLISDDLPAYDKHHADLNSVFFSCPCWDMYWAATMVAVPT